MNQLNLFSIYLITYIQPLLGLVIGIIMLIFVAYINWYKSTKANIIKWIAKYISVTN